MSTSLFERMIAEVFFRSWWVILILLLCLAFFEHEQNKRDEILNTLTARTKDLQHEKIHSLERHERLSMQINSQNDPSWVEMVLIKELGLTPEGQIKVHFTE